MEEDWESDPMMEFDHCQNIARAAFGDMLYDTERVWIKIIFTWFFLNLIKKYFVPIESIVLQSFEKRNYQTT